MKLEHCGRYLYALDHISPQDIIADISCATGYGSFLLAQKAKYAFGLDINKKYLNIAKSNYQKDNLEFFQADISQNLDILRHRQISAIISFETIEHTSTPFAAVKNFYDILPQSGKLFLSFPNIKCEIIDENGHSQDPHHLSVIDHNDMINFLKQTGFKINHILGQSMINRIITQTILLEQDLNLSFFRPTVQLSNKQHHCPKSYVDLPHRQRHYKQLFFYP